MLNWCKNAGINQQMRMASKTREALPFTTAADVSQPVVPALPYCAVGVGLQKPPFDGHFRACSVHINPPGERHKMAATLLIFWVFNVSIYQPTC